MKKLVYLCPVCKKRFEAHVHGDFYERKTLGCSKCGVIMNCAMEASEDARDSSKRT